MLEPLADLLSGLIARAERDPDVRAVILFGSQARGDAGPGPDVDVCVVLEAGPTPIPNSKRPPDTWSRLATDLAA
jgi:predicted nucleotidyltransferase